MRKRCKIAALVFALFIAMCLCGSCGTSQADELIRCMNEQDTEGLKDLFCEKVRESAEVDLDEQIDVVFELLENVTIESSNQWKLGYEQSSWEHHEKVWERKQMRMTSVKLSNGNELEEIYFYTSIIDKEHPEKVGISVIVIYDSNSQKYRIGKNSIVH